MSSLNTSSSHLPTKFSQPPNLHICITSSQFSLLAALARHLWSHSLARPHVIFTNNSSFQYASPLLWNNLSSVNHALIPPILPHKPSSLSAISSISSIDSPLSSSITPSLFHSRLKTFLQIFPTIAYLFFSWTDSTDSPILRYF